MQVSAFNRIFSYVLPVKLEEAESPQNGHLELLLYNGKIVLNSSNANYSFDSLHRVFREALWHVEIENAHQPLKVLVLGFGIGSIASILQKEVKLDCKITGVEHDPIILNWANTYFSYDINKSIQLTDSEAGKFVESCKEKFDLICVDLFKDTSIPDFLFEPAFPNNLKKLLNDSGRLIINTMLGEEKANELLSVYEKEFPDVYLKQMSEGNRLLFFVEE